MSRLFVPRSGFLLTGHRLDVFSAKRRAVFRLWPRTVAAAREPNGRWKRLAAEIDLAAPYLGTGLEDLDSVLGEKRRMDSVLRLMITRIPAGVRSVLALFPWRAFRPLQFLSRAPGLQRLLDLFRTNPALAFGLAHHAEHRLSAAAAHTLAVGPQRQALAALGYPDSESAARIFRKMTPGACTLQHLLRVREALRDPARAPRLAHCRRITADVVRALGDAHLAAHASDALLSELADLDPADSIGSTAAMLRDAVAMRNGANRAEGGGNGRAVYASVEAMRRDHDARMLAAICPPAPVAAERRQAAPAVILGPWRAAPAQGAVQPVRPRRERSRPLFRNLRYPDPPPLPRVLGIEPIRSQQEAIEEGQLMHHCLGNLAYDRRIFAGRAYLFRVVSPLSRATLSIIRERERFVIDGLSGVRNAPVPGQTRSAIELWLRGHPVIPATPRAPAPRPAPVRLPAAARSPNRQLYFAFAVGGDVASEE